MKPEQTETVLILATRPTFWRNIGLAFAITALAAFLFAFFRTVYFGKGDTISIVVSAAVSLFLGLIFSVLGYILVSLPDRKIEINLAQNKIFLTEKFIKTVFEEFSIADIEKIEMIEHDFENHTSYCPQVVLSSGKIIKLPSDNEGDKEKQTALFEQVRNFLAQ